MIEKVLFWQANPSPHQIPYIRELMRSSPWNPVKLVVERRDSLSRVRQGWSFELDDLCEQNLVVAPSSRWIDDVLRMEEALHVVSGLFAFQLGQYVIRRGLKMKSNIALLSEPPDPRGIRGGLRKLRGFCFERPLIRSFKPVFAIGPGAVKWFSEIGARSDHLFEYCYTTEPVQEPMASSYSTGGRLRVIFVGGLIPRKNVATLLRALDSVNAGQFELAIVGGGSERAALHRYVSTMRCPHLVRFLGTLPTAVARTEMAKADVLVLPSLEDGWGAVVNEALQVGTYCIASEACGSRALLMDHRRGATFDPKSARQLADRLVSTYQRKVTGNLDRACIREWAASRLSGRAVAEYFARAVEFSFAPTIRHRPRPPWRE